MLALAPLLALSGPGTSDPETAIEAGRAFAAAVHDEVAAPQ